MCSIPVLDSIIFSDPHVSGSAFHTLSFTHGAMTIPSFPLCIDMIEGLRGNVSVTSVTLGGDLLFWPDLLRSIRQQGFVYNTHNLFDR